MDRFICANSVQACAVAMVDKAGARARAMATTGALLVALTCAWASPLLAATVSVFAPSGLAPGAPPLPPRALLSASMWVAASSVPGTNVLLCLFADATLLLRASPVSVCGRDGPVGGPMSVPAPSPACHAQSSSPDHALRALHLVPSFMVASVHQRKRLIVLAKFHHGLICDVTQQVTWEAHTLSVWRLPVPAAFFTLQAKLADHVSNRAFIQGTLAK